jgi:hypothetical protein
LVAGVEFFETVRSGVEGGGGFPRSIGKSPPVPFTKYPVFCCGSAEVDRTRVYTFGAVNETGEAKVNVCVSKLWQWDTVLQKPALV